MALALLLSQRKDAVSFGLSRGFSIPRIGQQIERQLATGIAQSRILSRTAGIARVTQEIEPLGIDVAPIKSLAHEVHDDMIRAQRYANNYARQWVKKAEGDTVARATRAANADTLGSLKRTAVTESSQAFGDGRAKALEGIPGVAAHSLLKVWDAQLDKLTCPICGTADGTIVGIKESFPYGVPGAVHPNCRCSWQTLSFDEAKGYIEPKAPAKVISLPKPAAKPAEVPPKPAQPRLPKDAQLQQLIADGFTGSVPQQGLRPESFVHLRAGGAVHGGNVTLKIRSDGGVQIVDGRHRITLARERGDATIRTRILIEGPRGGIKHDVHGVDLKLGQATGPAIKIARAGEAGEQRVIAAKRNRRTKKNQ